MNAQRYPEEFRIEAVKQILEHGHSVVDVSRRLGVSTASVDLQHHAYVPNASFASQWLLRLESPTAKPESTR